MFEVAKPAGHLFWMPQAITATPSAQSISAHSENIIENIHIIELKYQEDELPIVRRIEFGPEARRRWCTIAVLLP
jgi:hypothetical protein